MVEDLKGTVIVYSIVGCERCEEAKQHLSMLRIPYTDISLDSFPQCRSEMERFCGVTADVPQIFFNNILVGDENDLKEVVRDVSRFDKLMEMIRNEESPPDAPPIPPPDTAIDYCSDAENEETEKNAADDSNERSDDAILCVPNEYSRLMTSMKKASIIKDNRVGSTIYRNSFKGEHFINWIMQQRQIKLKDALEIGQELIERQFGRQMSKESGDHFSPERYYQLRSGDESIALNSGSLTNSSMTETATISVKEMNDLLLTSLESFYEQILTDDRKYLNSTYYVIGGELYSLQSILNGILRANRRGFHMLWEPFGEHDRRLHLALDEPEPLVHFAVNCGTKSGPPIRLYTTEVACYRRNA
ncbi:unnamed protein product [Anisakis simplex]|uniref:Glutaredoxin domain-containing protein n=1 Tax=Anisakis simplex TaxID=6269 RepID=A0A0M3JTV1_ANISI|nr:unnamed protein product [Anisakis simplex]